MTLPRPPAPEDLRALANRVLQALDVTGQFVAAKGGDAELLLWALGVAEGTLDRESSFEKLIPQAWVTLIEAGMRMRGAPLDSGKVIMLQRVPPDVLERMTRLILTDPATVARMMKGGL